MFPNLFSSTLFLEIKCQETSLQNYNNGVIVIFLVFIYAKFSKVIRLVSVDTLCILCYEPERKQVGRFTLKGLVYVFFWRVPQNLYLASHVRSLQCGSRAVFRQNSFKSRIVGDPLLSCYIFFPHINLFLR